MKKFAFVLMLVALSLIFSACSPSEPPAESTLESSTPIEAPTETESTPYDLSKISFSVDGVVDFGEINDPEEYSVKTSELIEACKNFEERIEGGVRWVDSFMIDVNFKKGCDISDENLTETGLGTFERTENEDLSRGVRFYMDKDYADLDFFAAVLELSQNENIDHVKIIVLYMEVVNA